MAILNVSATGPVNDKASPKSIRCPVEETGRNSVMPSITPRIKALNRSIIYGVYLEPDEKVHYFENTYFCAVSR
jgi:hypothetical protein